MLSWRMPLRIVSERISWILFQDRSAIKTACNAVLEKASNMVLWVDKPIDTTSLTTLDLGLLGLFLPQRVCVNTRFAWLRFSLDWGGVG